MRCKSAPLHHFIADEFEEFFVSRQPEQGVETSDTSYKMRTIARSHSADLNQRMNMITTIRPMR
jgi:hypothetical protein